MYAKSMVEESLTALREREVLKWRDTGALLHSWSDTFQQPGDRQGWSHNLSDNFVSCEACAMAGSLVSSFEGVAFDPVMCRRRSCCFGTVALK